MSIQTDYRVGQIEDRLAKIEDRLDEYGMRPHDDFSPRTLSERLDDLISRVETLERYHRPGRRPKAR